MKSYPYPPDGVPFVAGSETSEAAAKQTNAMSDEDRVYQFMAERAGHGATDDEIETALGLAHQTASARRRTLELKRKVFRTSKTRLTRRQRMAGVYVVASCFVGPDLNVVGKFQKPSRDEMQIALMQVERAVGYPSAELAKLLRWLKK